MPLSTSPLAMIVAELIRPGFTGDLSTWTFTIDNTGSAVQQARISNVSNRFGGEARTLTAHLSPSSVDEIVAAATDGRFGQMAERYSVNDGRRRVTDLDTTALAFRLGDDLKRVEVHGAGYLAREGSVEMKLFVDLWQRIKRLLPYGGT